MPTTYISHRTGRSYRLPELPAITPEEAERIVAQADACEARNATEGYVDPDCPPMTEEQLARGIRPGRPPRSPGGTVVVNTRLDADVVAWLKRDGPGYQTRLNAIVRQAFEQAQRQADKQA